MCNQDCTLVKKIAKHGEPLAFLCRISWIWNDVRL